MWEVDSGIAYSDLQMTVGQYVFFSIYVWEDSEGLKLVHMLHQIMRKL